MTQQLVHDYFDLTRDSDGILTITMDERGRSANTMSRTFFDALQDLMDHLESMRDDATGVIVRSAKDTFFAGVDLDLVMKSTPADLGHIAARLDSVKACLRRLETFGKPVVAAINGAALGGGFEIALACHHRVALDARGVVVGLPEVTWGLLPGAGGTTRAVRMFGIEGALDRVLLNGTQYSATEALAIGLVDELVDEPDELLGRARQWILDNPDARQPWDQPGFQIPGDAPSAPAMWGTLASLPSRTRRAADGTLDAAAKYVLAAAVEGSQVDFQSAQLIETRYCADLICGPISTNLVKSHFFDLRAVANGLSRPPGPIRSTAGKVVVLGTGAQSCDIAAACAVAGIDVVLLDADRAAAEAAKRHIADLLEARSPNGSGAADRRAVLDRITPSAEPADTRDANVLVTTATDNSDVRQLPDSGNMVGLRLLALIGRPTVLEVIAHAKVSDEVVAKAFDLGRQLGAVPIVVRGERSFADQLVLAFVHEAFSLIGEGVPAPSVERAARRAGYLIGALALADLMSMETVRRMGGTDNDHPGAVVVDRMLGEVRRSGSATGGAFYDATHTDAVGSRLWSGLADTFGGHNHAVSIGDMKDRLMFAHALAAIGCLDAGVIGSSLEVNVGSIATGFPRWTGGALQYANQYDGGLGGFVERAHELAATYGERFVSPPSLVRRAAAGEEFQ